MISMLVLCASCFTVRPLLVTTLSLSFLFFLVIELNWQLTWYSNSLTYWLTNSQHSLLCISFSLDWSKATSLWSCCTLNFPSVALNQTVLYWGFTTAIWMLHFENFLMLPSSDHRLQNFLEQCRSVIVSIFWLKSWTQPRQCSCSSHPMYSSHDSILNCIHATNFTQEIHSCIVWTGIEYFLCHSAFKNCFRRMNFTHPSHMVTVSFVFCHAQMSLRCFICFQHNLLHVIPSCVYFFLITSVISLKIQLIIWNQHLKSIIYASL
jgi:hypothetical protein